MHRSTYVFCALNPVQCWIAEFITSLGIRPTCQDTSSMPKIACKLHGCLNEFTLPIRGNVIMDGGT